MHHEARHSRKDGWRVHEEIWHRHRDCMHDQSLSNLPSLITCGRADRYPECFQGQSGGTVLFIHLLILAHRPHSFHIITIQYILNPARSITPHLEILLTSWPELFRAQTREDPRSPVHSREKAPNGVQPQLSSHASLQMNNKCARMHLIRGQAA